MYFSCSRRGSPLSNTPADDLQPQPQSFIEAHSRGRFSDSYIANVTDKLSSQPSIAMLPKRLATSNDRSMQSVIRYTPSN